VATITHEEWDIRTSSNDANQVVLTYTDRSDPERLPVLIDPLDRVELRALLQILTAYLSLPKGLP
jgi:hypothetical protein